MGKGRSNRSAITTGEAAKLNIDKLVKDNCFKVGTNISFTSSWSNGWKINMLSKGKEDEMYLRVMYKQTNNTTKESKDFVYNIHIEKVKSNLGKGYNLYFLCPVIGKRCKILYLCYNSEMFKCREAYRNRIYYNSQTHSKEYRLNGRYFHIEAQLEKQYNMRATSTYKGKQTKRKTRLNKLIEKRNNVDELRAENFYSWLSRYIGVNP